MEPENDTSDSTREASGERDKGFDRFFQEKEYINLNDVIAFLREYALTIAIASLLSTLLGIFAILNMKPIYTAHGQLLIDPSNTGISESTATAQRVSLDAAQVASEIAVLTSETLAAAVVRKLNLTGIGEFRGTGKAPPAKPAPVAAGASGDAQPAVPENAVAEQVAIGILQKNLDIRRSGLSYAIDVFYSSGNPELAARIANEVSQTYIADQLARRAAGSKQTSYRLGVRIRNLQDQFNEAARALKLFRSGGTVSLPELPHESDTADPKNPDAVTLEVLEATVESYRRMYESAYTAYNEAVQREAFPLSDARILTTAVRPLSKSHPRSSLLLVMSMLGGLLLGLAIAFLRFNMDTSVRSAKQIRELTGLECLVQVPVPNPYWETAGPLGLIWIGIRNRLTSKRKRARQVTLRELEAVKREPFSPFASAIMVLKSLLGSPQHLARIRTIGISSALPGEGKSTLIANLAVLLARSGLKVLVIDADIHERLLSDGFGRDAETGLLEALQGQCSLQECVIQRGERDFSLLPVVAPQGEPISYELLGGKRMVALLDVLRRYYDIVLVDMPALTPVADAYAIGANLDGILLTAAWRETPMHLLVEITRALQVIQAHPIGIVLSKTESTISLKRLRGLVG